MGAVERDREVKLAQLLCDQHSSLQALIQMENLKFP